MLNHYQTKEEKSWVKYIKHRIRNNKNFIGFIGGPTGSGKSYSTLSIGEELDPNFNINQVVFSGWELMQLINSGNVKSGSVIAFEECGIGMSSKNWQSTTNKMINFLMQTFRHRRFILLLNSPYMDFVDASTRKLFHAEIMTQGIDVKNKTCKLKPRLIQYNQRYGKFYYKRLRVYSRELSAVVPIQTWTVSKPSAELIKEYEAKKKKFTDDLNNSICDELYKAMNKNQMKRRELSLRQQNVYDLLKEKLKVEQIAERLRVSTRMVNQVMQTIRFKGYKIDPVYSDKRTVKYYET